MLGKSCLVNHVSHLSVGAGMGEKGEQEGEQEGKRLEG
jgi:hypothetical protein